MYPARCSSKRRSRPMKNLETLNRGLWLGGIARTLEALYEVKTSAPTASTCCVFAISTLAHVEERAVATIDAPGVYLNCIPDNDGANEIESLSD